MASIKDLAKHAGVSASTVSFVLNGKGDAMRISKDTQARVRQAAKTLGYTANIQARQFRKAEFKPAIAVCVALGSPVLDFETVMKGIEDFNLGAEKPMDFILKPYSAEMLTKEVLEELGRDYHGQIFLGFSERERLLIESVAFTTPTCCIGWVSEHYGSVALDFYKTGQEVAEIASAHKLERVGFVGASLKDMHILNGLREGLAKRKIRFDTDYIWEANAIHEGERVAEEILELERLPELLLFANDTVAVSAMNVLVKHEIAIPEALKVIAIGSTPLFAHTIPSLTVVAPPIEDMLRDAFHMVEQGLKHREGRQKSYPPILIFRESCPSPPGKRTYRIFI